MIKLELTDTWQNIGNKELEVQLSTSHKARLYYGLTAPLEDNDSFLIQSMGTEFQTLKAPTEGFIWIKQVPDGHCTYIKYRTTVNSTEDYYLQVSKGGVSGSKVIHKFGRNPDISTTQFDAIWNGDGAYTGFNATQAELVTITSDSGEVDG